MSERAIIVLALAIVVSSVIIAYGVTVASGNIGQGLSKIQIVTTGGGSGAALAPTPSRPQATPEPAPSIDFKELTKSYAGAEGPENAKVTIVEFSDFQCPFCRRAYEESITQIRKEYVDTGKARLLYRDFPLSFHPMAQASAEAARCAGDQGKFWPMHDKMFLEQGKKGQGTVEYSKDDIKKWAKEIGLNTETFNTCFDSGKYTQAVQNDFNVGAAAGVSGTPTFFVNGQQLVGAQPYLVFKQVIEAELAK